MLNKREPFILHTAIELACELKIHGIDLEERRLNCLLRVINSCNRSLYDDGSSGHIPASFKGLDALVSMMLANPNHGLFDLPNVGKGSVHAFKWWMEKHSNVERVAQIKRIKDLIRQVSLAEPTGRKIAPHLKAAAKQLDVALKLLG